MTVARTVMETIRNDAQIAQETKDYLQWVFARRDSAYFFNAVTATLGYIPF